MNVVVLIGFAALGFLIVYKLIPSKQSAAASKPEGVTSPLSRPWFEVMDLPRDASNARIDARYRELSALYSEESLNQLEAELQDEARACRNEIDAAYHFSRFRRNRSV